MTSKSQQSNTSSKAPTLRLSANDYTVGWICAIQSELTAAIAMLDLIHLDLPQAPTDSNAYTLGSIGRHNIVVACLPKGRYGNASAGVCVKDMVKTFPSLKIGLMVGIGGGIPSSRVQLGDVVVSTPVGPYPGVIQWDLGKRPPDGRVEKIGLLNRPPRALLIAVAKLQAQSRISGYRTPQYLAEVEEKWPALGPYFTRPPGPMNVGTTSDGTSGYRENPQMTRPVSVRYGLILSGNKVMKRAKTRDEVNASLGGNALCFEMEAAGLMEVFPCIVIRGIADNSDEMKNNTWQQYAAGRAAAYAKELLQFVQLEDAARERPLNELMDRRRC